MPKLVIEIPRSKLPVDLCEMKRHLRVPESFTDDDADIVAYTAAATDSVEKYLNQILINTGFRQSLDNFPYYVDAQSSPQAFPPAMYSQPRYSSTQWNYSQQIKLLRGPVRQVSKITYIGTDNAAHDLFPNLDYQKWSRRAFSVGDQILDSNGNVQEVTTTGDGDGMPGSTEPTWPTNPDATVNDGHVIWTCRGPRTSSDFVVDYDSQIPRIFPKPGGVWPAALYIPNAVQIHFIAGSGTDPKRVQDNHRTAVKILTTGFYEFREPVSSLQLREIPWGVANLLGERALDFAPTRG